MESIGIATSNGCIVPATADMVWSSGEIVGARRKPTCTRLLSCPQISHGILRDWTWPSVVRSQRAMPELWYVKSFIYFSLVHVLITVICNSCFVRNVRPMVETCLNVCFPSIAFKPWEQISAKHPLYTMPLEISLPFCFVIFFCL